MKPPAFQFYADDFLAGTFTFTNEQRGLYITLLCLQWSQGSVSEATVKALAGSMQPETLAVVRAKFVPDEVDGSLRNQRLEVERQKQAAFRAKCSEAGRRSVEGRLKVPSRLVEGRGQPKGNSPVSTLQSPISNLQSPNSVTDYKERRFAPPTLEAVKLQAAKIGLPELEADAFLNYYEANGWRVGRNPMKSWVAALNNWKKNYDDRTYSNRGTGNGRPTPADQRNARIIGADEVRERERRAAADDAAGLTKMPYEPDYVSPRAQRQATARVDQAG